MSMGRFNVCAAGLGVGLGVCAPALADRTPAAWLLLDHELKPTPAASISAINAEEVRYIGTDAAEHTMLRGVALAIVPASWGASQASRAWSDVPGALGTSDRAPSLGVLMLTDGTRLTGTVDPAGTRGESLTWTHPVFGRFVAPLDQVRRIQMPPPDRRDDGVPTSVTPTGTPVPSGAVTSDRLVLANGDVVSGLLSSFTAGTGAGRGAAAAMVESLPGAGGERPPARTINLDRVQVIDLVNPPAPATGVCAWLEEGSVISGTGLTVSGQQAVLIDLPEGRRAAGPIRLGLVHLRAIALDAARVRPLSELSVREARALDASAASGVVRVDAGGELPALGAADVLVGGPATVTWDLPPGARRFSGRLVLPEASRVWGDCVVTMSAGGKHVLSHRLNAEAPDLAFNVPISGSTLEVRLEAGERGAIQDSALIQRGLIAVE